MRKLNFACSLASALVLVAGVAQAQNLLTNGGLDDPIPPPAFPGWSLVETVTGEASAVNSGEIIGFASQDPGGTGLWLRAFAGHIGDFAGQDKAINAFLSQTVGASAGETYTLTGYSRWEANYSGGVTNLDIDKAAPPDQLGPPSPTNTNMILEFLDGGNAVIGTSNLDLRTVQMNNNTWLQHSVVGVAPAGTVSARVTAQATDMKFNVDPGQSAFFDNFSLTGAGAPATELLTNGVLNLSPPNPPPGWNLTEAGGDTADFPGFADREAPPGLGLWLRPFVAAIPNGDANLNQAVAVVPGREITFSGWSRFEPNYSGGLPAGASVTQMSMQFLDGSNNPVGAPITLNVAADRDAQNGGPVGDANDNQWWQHVLGGIVPAGATQVRVSAIADNMFNTQGAQSAFFDDFSLTSVPEPASAIMLFVGALGLFGLARRR